MIWFLGGIAALICGMLLLNWLTNAKPKAVVKTLGWFAVLGVGTVILLILLTKNINFIWGVLPALFVWLGRLRMLGGILNMARMARSFAGPSPGNSSSISCRYFDLSLDHDSGDMDGRVKEGSFEGALLSELSLEEGQQLFMDVRASGDDRSLRLLEAFLDRRHGTAWRQGDESEAGTDDTRSQSRGRPQNSTMTREEALSLLGLPSDATEEDIRAAYKRIMKQVHPDTGGSAYLAAKVNEAKDLLLSP